MKRIGEFIGILGLLLPGLAAAEFKEIRQRLSEQAYHRGPRRVKKKQPA